MIEESFVRLYVHDFMQMAVKSELGQDVDASLQRRMTEARSHAALMDERKGLGHLAAVVERIRDEASRFDGRTRLQGTDVSIAVKRGRGFLTQIADALARPTANSSFSIQKRAHHVSLPPGRNGVLSLATSSS